MIQGVIQNLKAYYQRRIVCLCIKTLDKNKPLPKTTIIQVMKNFEPSHANQQSAATNADDPLKSLEEGFEKLRKLDQSAVQDNLSVESFIGFDREVATSASYMNDADILTEAIEDQDNDVI